ncbi:hypothetical protein [Falsochrobactrum shanghaiense]|nr:hypothetical protein [Falsochrobactrum shanghaiense]
MQFLFATPVIRGIAEVETLRQNRGKTGAKMLRLTGMMEQAGSI